MRRHPDVRVIALPQKDWRKLAQEAKKDQLDPATGLETCKWRSYVELVEYDDDLKKILGGTTESLAIVDSGNDVVYHVQGTKTRCSDSHDFLDNADIKSEPISLDYGDYVYDEEDIDMRFYCDDYEEDVIDVENDAPCTPEKHVKVETKTCTDSVASESSCSSSGKKKGKRKQLTVTSSSKTTSSGAKYNRDTNDEPPLSPSFHRPWQLPQSPKALPLPASSSQACPNARSPRLSSPVQPTPLSAPPQHTLPHYNMSPQPYLLPSSQRPEQSLSASPYPFHQISSPPAIPLYPSFSSATRDYPPSPVREFSRAHSFPGLPPPPGYHGYHHPSSPGHAPGRMISLVPPPGMSGSATSPSLATITHEQQILPNVSVVTLEHLQAYQHLHGTPGIHQVQGYPPHYHHR